MMTRIRVRPVEDGYALRLHGPQAQAIRLVLQFLGELAVTEAAWTVQVGCDRPRLAALYDRVAADEERVFSLAELHILHSALVVAENQFPSEESFHIRIGFYREHIAGLARGLVTALNVSGVPME